MIVESPLLQEILDEVREEARQAALREGRQASILDLLEDRFGPVPSGIVEHVRGIHDDARLRHLLKAANDCPDLASFEAETRELGS